MQILSADDFVRLGKKLPIVDVRSPGEFAEGHIPGAHNIPIFDDGERALIGSIYKNEGRVAAIEKGLEFVGPRMAQLARQAAGFATSGQLLLYCWRGGMRSESMAWLFEKVDIQCFTLKGGYKSYRKYVIEKAGSIPHLIVIEGYTGCGKTEIIHSLEILGEQVIDLEKLANHRGSVFGGIGQEPQPTTQQFQNELVNKILQFDLTKRVWVEGEGQNIGRVVLPDAFWNKMNGSVTIEIQLLREARISRLVNEYGSFSGELMENAICSIAKRLGTNRMNNILHHFREKKFDVVADKLLEYYDQTYQFSHKKYKKMMTEVVLSHDDAKINARLILDKIGQMG